MYPEGHSQATLPEDVLLYIFELGAREYACFGLKLTCICQYWRTLALATSILWSNISVVNDYETHLSAPVIPRATSFGQRVDEPQLMANPEFQQLQCYLYYSRNRSLDIEIRLRMPRRTARNDESNGGSDLYHHRTRVIGRLLFQHSHRIRSLMVKADSYSAASSFFNSLKGSGMEYTGHNSKLPIDELKREWGRLEDFRVQWTGSVWSFEEMSMDLQNQSMLSFLEEKTSIFSRKPSITPAPVCLPQLRRLMIRGLAVNWQFFAPANLKELHILDMHSSIKPTLRQLKAILLANQATLKELSLIDACEYSEVDNDSVGQVVLPALRTLSLGYRNALDLCPVVTVMRSPALKIFAIQNVRGRKFEVAASSDLTDAQANYFASTRALFITIVENWDLSMVETLTLTDVQFLFDNVGMPPNPLSHMEEVEKLFEDDLDAEGGDDWSISARALLPVDFWQKCGGLKNLILIRPDPVTLYTVYCPAPPYAPYPRHFDSDHESDHRNQVIVEPTKADLADGLWHQGSSGKWLRFPLPKLENFWLGGASKDVAKEFFVTRKALAKRIAAGKPTTHTKYRFHPL
ncbi:hypothetical protein BDN72DRAFT_928291 [Pluteus cervinus]|uniref:Uncharacterized protein n=1 Tax=Pluteus cervinus TaxID=181527 RepID=A0ACD3AD23_9AGAR|nr:hypothetical protein BDN72DRAFT_928291 [Pluteus cervinus]